MQSVTSDGVKNAFTALSKFASFGGAPNQTYTMDLSDLTDNRSYIIMISSPYANVGSYLGIMFKGAVIKWLKELTSDFINVTLSDNILSITLTYESNNPMYVQIINV